MSLACFWDHRTLIFRALKGVDSHILVSVVGPDILETTLGQTRCLLGREITDADWLL